MDSLIQCIVDHASHWDVVSLERRGDPHNFSDVHPLVERAHSALLDLRTHPEFWAGLAEEKQSMIKDNIVDLSLNIEMIRKFDPSSAPNPGGRRRTIVRSIHNTYNQLYRDFFLPLEVFMIRKDYEECSLEQMHIRARNEIDQLLKPVAHS